jgi:hypothetical protein
LVNDLLSVWPILLGWPALVVSLMLSGTGILRRRPSWLVGAAILIVPLAGYVATGTGASRLGLAAPLLLLGGGLAVRSRAAAVAWLCWGCVVALGIALAMAVFDF